MIDILSVLRNSIIFNGGFSDFSEIEDVYNGLMAILCVVCAGLAAGLTIGLLSLDETKLEIKAITGNKEEKEAALKILPVIKRHHLLLVTLLLFNSIANETLPIFLGSLVPNFVAVILSVTLVLIFGEIIPSAVFTGPDQLLTAAQLTGLVYFLTTILYPIAYPISKLLDYMLGEDEASTDLSRKELEALFHLQAKKSNASSLLSSPQRGGTPILDEIRIPDEIDEECFGDDGAGVSPHAISHQEINLMSGILRLSKLSVRSAMKNFKTVFMVSNDFQLDERGLYSIVDSGYSRIPIYKCRDKQHLLGYMLTRDLIGISASDNNLVKSLALRQPVIVGPHTPLLEMLSIFQSGHCHMAFISSNPNQSLRYLQSGERPSRNVTLLGIVCLEDVLEKIIQEDIIDESDYIRNTKHCHGDHRGSDNVNQLPRSLSKSALSSKLMSINRRASTSGTDMQSLLPRSPSRNALSTPRRRASTGSQGHGLVAVELPAISDQVELTRLYSNEETEYNTYQNGQVTTKMDVECSADLSSHARRNSYEYLEMDNSHV